MNQRLARADAAAERRGLPGGAREVRGQQRIPGLAGRLRRRALKEDKQPNVLEIKWILILFPLNFIVFHCFSSILIGDSMKIMMF